MQVICAQPVGCPGLQDAPDLLKKWERFYNVLSRPIRVCRVEFAVCKRKCYAIVDLGFVKILILKDHGIRVNADVAPDLALEPPSSIGSWASTNVQDRGAFAVQTREHPSVKLRRAVTMAIARR